MQPGERIGRYTVVGRLGVGGMGEVYLVDNAELGRREAMKVVSVAASAKGGFEERFRREARAIATLDHPGIVTIYSSGIDHGRPWYAMQYVDGADLTDARLPVAETVEVVGRIADALDYAHSRGMVHRDVKPANIMTTRRPDGGLDRVTLLDFGIAKLADSTQLTITGAFIGTVSYSAPETLDGRADPRADQYSLACVAYELLTGRPPFAFDGATPMATATAHLYKAPPLVRATRPDLAVVDPVFQRALAKNPDARFPDCRSFARALAAALGEAAARSEAPGSRPRGTAPLGTTAPGRPAPGAPFPVPTTTTAPGTDPSSWQTYPGPVGAPTGPPGLTGVPGNGFPGGAPGRPPKRGRTMLILALVVVLVLASAGTAAYLLLGGDSETTAEAPPENRAQQMVIAGQTACAVNATGTLFCWGANDDGATGFGQNDGWQNDPKEVVLITDATAVSGGDYNPLAGEFHSNLCAISAGDVYCWGSGRTKVTSAGYAGSSIPVKVDGVSDAVLLSAQGGNACAVTAAEALYCWGGNLGADQYSTSARPVQISELSTVTAVAVAQETSCAVHDGSLSCWGANKDGQLGQGHERYLTGLTAVDLPGRVSAVAVGSGNGKPTHEDKERRMYNVCAVADGDLYCWGANVVGQLGDGTKETRRAPEKVPDLSEVTAVTTDIGSTCAIASGKAYCWGNNKLGQLGDGTKENRTSPTEVKGLPGTPVAITTGSSRTCAQVKVDGRDDPELHCWGNNFGNLFAKDAGDEVLTPVKIDLPA
ncbi:serine/threonine protein kinase [Gordonia iterans]|uniref:non-specific serine/threonine protein kinase n=1 Tax=Gordonia iterans TaxID=1004901 RepID=A0A2S0KF44_9ACTN|nr:protein kinase [Gordonia iterans]AVM00251.1 serine/threonine protein kinase [Gordonia iterans]